METVGLRDRRLLKVHELRFITAPGYGMVEFIEGLGELRSGQLVRLIDNVQPLPKHNLNRELQFVFGHWRYGRLGVKHAINKVVLR